MSADAILVIEDDDAIASGLVRVLEGQGYSVRRLGRGTGAVSAADPSVGLVVLDLGLPDVDGLDVCRRLRAARPDLAILILTARDLELDIVAGLDAGADDYLVKPFRLSELLARIRSHLRRRAAVPPSPPSPSPIGSLRIDRSARRAWLDDTELDPAAQGVRPAHALRLPPWGGAHPRADHAGGLGDHLARIHQDP